MLAACGPPAQDEAAPGASPTPAPTPDQADDGVAGEACGPAPFAPARLPWSENAGEPDAVVDETDRGWGVGITSMWWWEEPPAQEPDGAGTTPWAGEDGTGNRYVVLQRGVDADALRTRGVDADDAAVDGTVRGHPATFRATGDPGVGGASLHWAEEDERCDHYLLIVQPWDTEQELWSLAPTQ